MRALLTSSPSQGLLYPLLPLAWALRAAGHEVLVAAPANMAGEVTAAGLPFAASAPPLDVGRACGFDRDGQPVPKPSEEAALLGHIGRGFGRIAEQVLPGLRKLAARWRPDLLITEHHEYAGPEVAAERGIPWVLHPVGLGESPELDRYAAAELGVPPREPDLVVDCCPPSLARADARPAFRVRYLPYNPSAVVPRWAAPDGTWPRVLVSVGTRVPRTLGPGVLRRVVDGVAGLGGQVLVAVADDLVAELGPLPDGVRAGWLPVDQLLPSCDLAVHHCGSGTLLAGLVAAVPQLLIPYVGAQRDMARRVAAAGAAVALMPGEDTTDAVAEACGRLLKDDSYRGGCDRIAAEFAALPPLASVVAPMRRLAGSHDQEGVP
jgi:UDP:flavonoid glycosyltransferase YjiC (YdhE family)